MWLYKHKYNADGTLSRYKSRLVANGKSQEQGINFDEIFSLVIKPATIRLVLRVAVQKDWLIHQLDVQNTFLHGNLTETVYMKQPPGFVSTDHPDYVCLLNKAIYGLKQALRAWNARFATYIKTLGFQQSNSDTSLFVFHNGSDMAYLLLYVDDIMFTASTTRLVDSVIAALKTEFPMIDQGRLCYFLGISVEFNYNGIFLSHEQYTSDLLLRAGMQDCKPISTHVDLSSKLKADASPKVQDPTMYCSLAGALQYLTFTRTDISYAVQQICLYMHDPRASHLHALHRILRYIKGTPTQGLQISKSLTTTLMAYSDADWAGCSDTQRSTSGYCVFLGNTLLSWSFKRQTSVSRSSAEAEYKGVANVVAETCWLRNLLLDLHCPILKAIIVFCDNINVVYLSTNHVQHQRTKHVEIDIHFVREKVAKGEVRVIHIPAKHQYADIFTKGLPAMLFNQFKSNLGVITRLMQLREGIS